MTRPFRLVPARHAMLVAATAAFALALSPVAGSPTAAAADSPTAAAAAPASAQGVGRAPTPDHLSTNHLPAPMDVDHLGAVAFGWQLARGDQAAYQLQVRDADGVVWDSGKVASANSTHVAYDGPALSAAERYTWRVRVWSDPGNDASTWSAPGEFGTGPGATWQGAHPIWASSPGGTWTDYTLSVRLRVDSVATGVRFRSPDALNGYMWQFRSAAAGSNVNTLVRHTLVNGRYTALPAVPLPQPLATGTFHDVRISAQGATITTYLDGTQVDRTDTSQLAADARFDHGTFGFRNGSSEVGSFDDVVLRSGPSADTGKVLFAQGFDDGKSAFPCGSVAGGVLTVGRSGNCLVSVGNADWSLMRDQVRLDPDKQVAWASLFATGSSPEPARQFVYKAYVDGTFVGLGPTLSLGDEVRYDGFDVTQLVASGGEHTLSAIAYTQKDQRFLGELVVRYTDGTTDTFGTGDSWTAMPGGSVWPAAGSIGTSYYSAPQEDLDERAYPQGFRTNGFDDSAWDAATVKADFTDLQPTPTAEVGEQLHAPVKVVDKGNGDYFVDFGRTWVGGARLQLQGTAGDQVTLRFGEETAGDDTVKYRMRTGNTYEDVVTLRDGPQTVETWGMRVFRYAEIIGSPEPVTADNLRALALVYPFDEHGATLTSSDEDLVTVWQLSKNTIEALNQNLYMDSWTRERTDYEADAYLQQLADGYLSADPTLAEYSNAYFRNHRTWPTEWPLYVVTAAYDDWQHTGSTGHLSSMYDTLKADLPDEWFSAATGTVDKDYRSNGCSSQTDCDIVDWPTSERDGFVFTPQNTVINALSFRTYRDMAEIADVLGHPDDAANFAAKADAIRASLNERFYDPATGAYVDGLTAASTPVDHRAVHASVFPAALGVPTSDAQRADLASYIADKGMVCSVYCSGFLLQALYNGGAGQAALDLLTSHDTTSWMNMVEQGAGATGEAWDPSLKSNMTWSHPWAAAPAYVVPRDMYGVRPTSPGWRTFTVQPQTGDQEYGSVTVPTVRGTIGVAFQRTAGRTDLGVQVPGNSTATVSVPTAGSRTLGTVFVDRRAVRADVSGGWASVEVEPGCHTVSVVPNSRANTDERLAEVCTVR
jgi:alpha-L-rhamnosidase